MQRTCGHARMLPRAKRSLMQRGDNVLRGLLCGGQKPRKLEDAGLNVSADLGRFQATCTERRWRTRLQRAGSFASAAPWHGRCQQCRSLLRRRRER
jgi:hypothetical protein